MFNLGKVVHEISHRWYLIVGGTAWLSLAMLAATSTDGMVRRLGAVRWRRLHQLVYVIALLALIHYFQQTKADVTVPTLVAGLFGWLIAYRLVAWWQGASELSTLTLLGLAIAVSFLTFAGEAIGIGIAFHVSPLRVLRVAFDFSAGIRPGWQVLAAGLCVVALDAVRSRRNSRMARTRPVAAE
jgi:methionine sulfoxide reductase heme-binding subunit